MTLMVNQNVGFSVLAGVTAGKTITRFKIYAPSDVGCLGGAGGTTVRLEGFNGSIWTTLYTSGAAVCTTAGSSEDVTSGIDVSTAYLEHRVNGSGNGSNGFHLSEVEFYDVGGLISAALGTKIGNLTAGGGLNAAFDGNTSQAAGTGTASISTSNVGYDNHVGKQWPA